jgi:hypothetical protein
LVSVSRPRLSKGSLDTGDGFSIEDVIYGGGRLVNIIAHSKREMGVGMELNDSRK